MVFVGVDIGGTKTSAGLIHEDGYIDNLITIKTVDNRSELLNNTVDLILQVIGDSNVKGIGVGVAGFLNRSRDTILKSPNLNSLNGFNIKTFFEEKLKLPVVIENDVNVAVWGEYKAGSGKGCRNVSLIASGTGVGGGIVVNGDLLLGRGLASEVGHIQVVKDGLLCGCGRLGCLEMYASGSALKRMVSENAGRELTYDEVYNFLSSDHIYGVSALYKVGEWLGYGFYILDRVVHSDVYVLGGGIAGAGDVVLDGAVNGFMKAGGSLMDAPVFCFGALDNNAGVVGAGLLARSMLDAF